MDGLGQAVGLIGGLCGIIVLLTGAFVYARGSYSKATIIALREDNQDLRNRVDDLEKKEELQSKDIERLTSENVLLKGMVTQRAPIEDVITLVTEHHEQAIEYWASMLKELAAVATALGRFTRQEGT